MTDEITNPPQGTGGLIHDGDVFRPTLQDRPLKTWQRGPDPWRVRSQLWVAFFGGSLALLAIAYRNGQRLKLTPAQQRTIILAGAGGFLLTIATSLALDAAAVDNVLQTGFGGRGFRLSSRAMALLAYVVMARVQRPAERVHRFSGGEYASLWRPGILAVFALGTLQNLIVTLLVQ